MSFSLPVVPLRDLVIFPGTITPIFVGRSGSILALREGLLKNGEIFFVAQKESQTDLPTKDDLYTIGTVCKVIHSVQLQDGTIKIMVEGLYRAKIYSYYENSIFLEAKLDKLHDINVSDEEECNKIIKKIIEDFEKYSSLHRRIPSELHLQLVSLNDIHKISYIITSHLAIKVEEKQDLLSLVDPKARIELVAKYLEMEIGVLNIEKKIKTRIKKQMERSQREYYLNEQLKAIQKELGSGPEEIKDEIQELEAKILESGMHKEAQERAMSDLRKLKMSNPVSSEATVIRNYLEWLVSIPWRKNKKAKRSLADVEKILNSQHYSLHKIKERIIEYISVQQRVGHIKGPILCLVGPPGVGKTSLAKSIADATGRNFVRISLGGVRDEAEIRGHRRTYIGAMPGKIIQAMKKAKVSNPLILLDEIDKLGNDFRGDPAAALLEVLDPEQNTAFNDHYLEVDYDLSDVMFVTTANSLKMSRPLIDRMEILRLSGYTHEEKIAIAQNHLIQKQKKEHGLANDTIVIDDECIKKIIFDYTRESGVRDLDRKLAQICRRIVRKHGKSKKIAETVKAEELEQYLDIPHYTDSPLNKENTVGVTTGLAWTENGGEILQIESLSMKGKGKVIITGKLGDVMQESVQAAASYVRSKAAILGIDCNIFEQTDIHVHVPEGAIPKDGPSAGIAMCTSIVSVLTGIPVKRDVAMTGEITLRGGVLPIGGLKEKLLAAQNAGVKTVVIPRKNAKDLVDVPQIVKNSCTITLVDTIDEVLACALEKVPLPLNNINIIADKITNIVHN